MEKEVCSIIERYRDRFNDGDADGLAAIYTPDISFVNLGGVPFDGRQAIRDQQASGFRGPLDGVTLGVEIEDVAALGTDYVLARVRMSISGRAPDRGFVPSSTVTMILDHTSGSWLIRHLQNTAVISGADGSGDDRESHSA